MEYRHKLTGEKLKMKRDLGEVCSCWVEKPYPLHNSNPRVMITAIVCLKENLIPITEENKPQLTLF